ncbi:hypothetical protein LU293_04110 [Moraxella nasovis]|uniref:hypothetical protein n=1 Tax=Moraxella nasovis TaxID=2904121 RepID=UPI001F61F2B6|nr:hypothetical protein [Moraxella nasovis]UNU74086.1 hypothetical protein LU293_04110 [Moraxella nasovis]
MANTTKAQARAVKQYQQTSESWTVRTKDEQKMQMLKQAKATGNLSKIFFEFLEEYFKKNENNA